jgi:hypothetical protein
MQLLPSALSNLCSDSDWIYGSYISLCSGMPKHHKVVSITTGRKKLAQRLRNMNKFPLPPRDAGCIIECSRSGIRIDLLVRPLNITPTLPPPQTAAVRPAKPIPIRGPSAASDHGH